MKASALANVFEKYPQSTKEILNIIKNKKLDYLLPSVFVLLKKKADIFILSEDVTIESPFELSSEAKKQVEMRVGEKITKERINKDMIAGFKVYTKNSIMDASLDNLLKQIIK